jgi:hypothetical protein
MTTKTPPDQTVNPASARALGAAVRGVLKKLGIPWKVSCSTTSFSGFGYGSCPFAKIKTERALTYIECSALADAVRALRADPDGGKGIIQLEGSAYAFGGAIGYKDYPSGADFWRQVGRDLKAEPMVNTPVIKEAERRVLLAYGAERPSQPKDAWCKAWVQYCLDHPESRSRGWPDIYVADEAPSGWPGIAAFEGKVVKP